MRRIRCPFKAFLLTILFGITSTLSMLYILEHTESTHRYFKSMMDNSNRLENLPLQGGTLIAADTGHGESNCTVLQKAKDRFARGSNKSASVHKEGGKNATSGDLSEHGRSKAAESDKPVAGKSGQKTGNATENDRGKPAVEPVVQGGQNAPAEDPKIAGNKTKPVQSLQGKKPVEGDGGKAVKPASPPVGNKADNHNKTHGQNPQAKNGKENVKPALKPEEVGTKQNGGAAADSKPDAKKGDQKQDTPKETNKQVPDTAKAPNKPVVPQVYFNGVKLNEWRKTNLTKPVWSLEKKAPADKEWKKSASGPGKPDSAKQEGNPQKWKPPQNGGQSGSGVDPLVAHNFNLILNEPMACKTPTGLAKDVFLLILVVSMHDHRNIRQAIRDTWGSPKELRGRKIVTLFLLGKSDNSAYNLHTRSESGRTHDILMEDFMDNYKNLSLKTMMAMKWVGQYCPQASYVLKVDDDMYISQPKLFDLLTDLATPKNRFVTGHVFSFMEPIRDSTRKNYMPVEIFRGPKYPPYCAGAAYVMSGDVPQLVYSMAALMPRYVHIEDVLVGICLKKLGIAPVQNNGFRHNKMPFIPYQYCDYRGVITMHGALKDNMLNIWESEHQDHNAETCKY